MLVGVFPDVPLDWSAQELREFLAKLNPLPKSPWFSYKLKHMGSAFRPTSMREGMFCVVVVRGCLKILTCAKERTAGVACWQQLMAAGVKFEHEEDDDVDLDNDSEYRAIDKVDLVSFSSALSEIELAQNQGSDVQEEDG